MMFLLGANEAKYGWYIAKLENDANLGNDQYPDTVTGAYNILANLNLHEGGRHRQSAHNQNANIQG